MNSTRSFEWAAFKILKTAFALAPRSFCLFTGRVLGLAAYRFDRKHRRLALANLEQAFGAGTPRGELKRRARRSFAHFGEMTAEILRLPHLSEEKIRRLITVEGENNIRRALEQRRGALIFTAHIGNWEIATFPVSRLGTLHVIARPLDNDTLESEILKLREKLGARVIYKQKAAREILQALRKNEMVAILIDQNVLRKEAVFVDFFGKQAATTPGLAAFALRTGAPIIPLFCLPGPKFTYRLTIGEPLRFDLSGTLERDVLKITEHCTKMIEREIRKHPETWLWFHNRWKTRPAGEDSGDPAVESAGNKD